MKPMQHWTIWAITGVLTFQLGQLAYTPLAYGDAASDAFRLGQKAYAEGQLDKAVDFFQQAVNANPEYTDAYYNLGALYYNEKKYADALTAFNQVLQRDPNDQSARFETARIFEKLGRPDEAIAAYEIINADSSRYSQAQDSLQRLRSAQIEQMPSTTTGVTTPPSAPITASTSPPTTVPQKHSSVTTTGNQQPRISPVAKPAIVTPPTQQAATEPTGQTMVALAPTASVDATDQQTSLKNTVTAIQPFAQGFFGPTGLVIDAKGTLYVANYSKNTIYTVSPTGEKKLFASGAGINGPVGMAIDTQTGNLYITNHLDNSIALITPAGKISVIATGLKKPYNLFLDTVHHALYVSQQEDNSIAKILLN